MNTLADDYAVAGFDGHPAFGKRPALLLVDVCNAYLDPASPLYAGVEEALASNVRLLAAARAAKSRRCSPVSPTARAGSTAGCSTARFPRSPPISTAIRLAIFLRGSLPSPAKW